MKQMNLPNSNNKLENNVFIHIAAAPDKPILESELPFHVQINEVVKTELSFQEIAAGIKTVQAKVFEADMIDFKRCELHEISSIYTYLSHGIDREKFLQENKGVQKLAIYIYKKR
jgi:hypothetical protein